MSKPDGRRDFISKMRNVIAVGGLPVEVQVNATAAETSPLAAAGEDYYDKLGVTKIINAAGTYTAMTASIMPPSVQAAVAAAGRSIPFIYWNCKQMPASIWPRS